MAGHHAGTVRAVPRGTVVLGPSGVLRGRTGPVHRPGLVAGGGDGAFRAADPAREPGFRARSFAGGGGSPRTRVRARPDPGPAPLERTAQARPSFQVARTTVGPLPGGDARVTRPFPGQTGTQGGCRGPHGPRHPVGQSSQWCRSHLPGKRRSPPVPTPGASTSAGYAYPKYWATSWAVSQASPPAAPGSAAVTSSNW